MNKPIRIDFFHDVICGWCYVLSPRLRQLDLEFNLEINHHAFALSSSREEMIAKFGGSMTQAKSTILKHWEQCSLADDFNRINVEGMRSESFEYPFSMPGLIACKAAKLQGGSKMYWNYFDAVTHAHMSQHRNIGDLDVLTNIAKETGLDTTKFLNDYSDPQRTVEIKEDRAIANGYGIHSTPSLVINQGLILSGALDLQSLKNTLLRLN